MSPSFFHVVVGLEAPLQVFAYGEDARALRLASELAGAIEIRDFIRNPLFDIFNFLFNRDARGC